MKLVPSLFSRRRKVKTFAAAAVSLVCLLTLASAIGLMPRWRLGLAPSVEASMMSAPPARDASAAQATRDAAAVSSTSHIRRGGLWPQLRPALTALGDRLEKPGKERLSFNGTLQVAGEAAATPVTVIRELPDRLRLERSRGHARDVTVFDGNSAHAGGRALGHEDDGLVESLVYDIADYFFLSLADGGGAARRLGDRFRLKDAAEDGAGPSYDVYELSFTVRARGQEAARTKVYYFNSATHLLESVRYAAEGGVESEVEVRMSGWQKEQGQSFPTTVVRSEGGRPVWTLTLALSAVGPAAQDGAFSSR